MAFTIQKWLRFALLVVLVEVLYEKTNDRKSEVSHVRAEQRAPWIDAIIPDAQFLAARDETDFDSASAEQKRVCDKISRGDSSLAVLISG